MTKLDVKALPDRALWAIVRSTSSQGSFWTELSWAKDELQRRANKKGKHIVGFGS